MLLEEANEFAHFRFLRGKIARMLRDLDKAVAVACFFDLRKKEIQLDKINVLDFISPSFNELSC
jgi:hypothetical protein